MKTKSKQSIFEEIGFQKHVGENLKIKTQLCQLLVQHIEGSGLTQMETASQLAVTQPRVSDLMCGKISMFSIEKLISMLLLSGFKVSLKINYPTDSAKKPVKKRAKR